jgi:hypothetical protein
LRKLGRGVISAAKAEGKRMTVDLYTHVGAYSRVQAVLSHLLDRAGAFAAAQGVSEAEMLGWKLAPDMFDLRQQAVSVIDFGPQWLARAVGVTPPPGLEGATTVAELKAASAASKAFIDALKPEQFAGRDEVPLTFDLGQMSPTFPLGQWLPNFATPNVYFHLSMAYAILRAKGLDLGKRDFFAGGL